jgi:hypothetical protein
VGYDLLEITAKLGKRNMLVVRGFGKGGVVGAKENDLGDQ